ncbi:MAG: phage tail protein [Lachnospiraceae bacterium]|nr:phage tail protein [Lachnospiraceae bacterium]
MSDKNKVKFGLKNCHYAKATFDEDGGVTYDTPVRIPGAVSLSMDPSGDPEPFYADNIVYYVVANNNGYEGDLEIALVPESFLTDIMHEELDANGVLAERNDVELEHFALLFEFDGDVKKTRHVLYNCTATRPAIEGSTIEDSKEPQTETLTLSAAALANGYVKAKTASGTLDDVYANWYSQVYEPQAVTETASTEEETAEDDGGEG